MQGAGIEALNIGRFFRLAYIVLLAVICTWLLPTWLDKGLWWLSLLAVAFVLLTFWVFSARTRKSWQLLYPALTVLVWLVLLPLGQTVAISFSNKSHDHRLTYEQARTDLLAQKYVAAINDNYHFELHAVGEAYRVVLTSSEKPMRYYQSQPLTLIKKMGWLEDDPQEVKFDYLDKPLLLEQIDALPATKKASIKELIHRREHLREIEFVRPDDPDSRHLTMIGLRKFSYQRALFTPVSEVPVFQHPVDFPLTDLLFNHQTKQYLVADRANGEFRYIDDAGAFYDDPVEPGFTVNVGWANYWRLLTDPGIPLGQVALWTLSFVFIVAGGAFLLGASLAVMLHRQQAIGRRWLLALLIMPALWSLPIAALMSKGIFNQSFGELNLLLGVLLDIKPNWFTTPALARTMVCLLGILVCYPWVLLCSHFMIKRASLKEQQRLKDGKFIAVIGRYLWRNGALFFCAILLTLSFNISLIDLLTSGRPDIIGSNVPVGETDTISTMAYHIGSHYFSGYGLSTALSSLFLAIMLWPIYLFSRHCITRFNVAVIHKERNTSATFTEHHVDHHKAYGWPRYIALLWMIPLTVVMISPLLVLLYVSFRHGDLAPSNWVDKHHFSSIIWDEQYSLKHWWLAFGNPYTEVDGSARIAPFPLMLWLYNSLKVSALSAFMITTIAVMSALGLARLDVACRKWTLIMGLFAFIISATSIVHGQYFLAELLTKVVPWLGLNSHISLAINYLPLSLLFAVLAYWLGIGSVVTNDSRQSVGAPNNQVINAWRVFWYSFRDQKMEITVIFLASVLICISEPILSSWLLADVPVKMVTASAGLSYYLYTANYLWGDFAAAALIANVPYATGLIITLLLLNRIIKKPMT